MQYLTRSKIFQEEVDSLLCSLFPGGKNILWWWKIKIVINHRPGRHLHMCGKRSLLGTLRYGKAPPAMQSSREGQRQSKFPSGTSHVCCLAGQGH